MYSETHVVAVCGSLRDESRTRIALEEALEASAAIGATTQLIDLRDYALPQYGLDGKDAGDAPELRAALDAADGIILGTPVYHGSYSSPLKAALDYSGRDEFRGKSVGMIAIAGGRFPTKCLEHLRNVCRHINAWVLPTEVAIPNANSAIEEGEITDPAVADRVQRLGKEVVQYAHIERLPQLMEESLSNHSG